MRTHNDGGKQDRIMGMRGKPTAGLWDMGITSKLFIDQLNT